MGNYQGNMIMSLSVAEGEKMPNTGKSQKLASFNVDVDDWSAFKVLARENKTNASKLLQGFIRQYIGKIPVRENEVVDPGKIIQLEEAIAQLTAEVVEIKKSRVVATKQTKATTLDRQQWIAKYARHPNGICEGEEFSMSDGSRWRCVR